MAIYQQAFVEAHGARIPVIGLGTSPMTGEVCSSAVHSAIAAGYQHIDTSANSGNESSVGEGLRRAGVPRAELFVTTKVWRTELHDGALQRSAEASLRRLGLSYLDLLLVHWPNPDIPLAETMRALASVRSEGLARHVGVANFPPGLLREALALCPAPIVANQCEYHPRLDQRSLLQATRECGAAFISYSPLGRGDPVSSPLLSEIAMKHGRSTSQILLRWHVQQDRVCAVPRSSNPARITENIAVFDFALDAAEMAVISSLAQPGGRMVNPPFAPSWDCDVLSGHVAARSTC